MNTEPELITTVIKMTSLLILFIGGLWGISWFAKKKLNVPGAITRGKKIKIIENCHLGVKKSISLVQVPGKVLVLGITGDNLTLLSELDETLVSDSYPDKENDPGDSEFSKQLKRFSKNFKRNT